MLKEKSDNVRPDFSRCGDDVGAEELVELVDLHFIFQQQEVQTAKRVEIIVALKKKSFRTYFPIFSLHLTELFLHISQLHDFIRRNIHNFRLTFKTTLKTQKLKAEVDIKF